MAQSKKQIALTEEGRLLTHLMEQSQVDFELEFFSNILQRHPSYLEILRIYAQNLAKKKRFEESLQVDRRIIRLCPSDPMAHYNLACGHALLQQPEQAIATLRKAIELGYRDFSFIRQDHDLDSIRKDPRFRKLLRKFDNR